MRIPAEAIAAVRQFGYTAREAEFLYIVAAHFTIEKFIA